MKLAIPEDPRTAAFKAVRRRLREDPILRRVIAKFYNTEPEKWVMSELPVMIIGMKAGPIRVSSPQSHTNSIVIGVDYAVSAEGMNVETAWEDITNLYGQIEKAINPFGNHSWLSEAIHVVDPTAVLEGSPSFSAAGYSTIPQLGANAILATCMFSIPIKVKPCRTPQS